MKFPEMRHHGKSDSRGGFTLLEMLIVIVIIIVLMGVVFKLSKGAMLNAERAKEVATVAKLKALAEEFHAEYGIYPPVPEYDGKQAFLFNGPEPLDANDLTHYVRKYNNYGFAFGFMSYFVDRTAYAAKTFELVYPDRSAGGNDGAGVATDAWNKYNEKARHITKDQGLILSARDAAFIKRVKPIVDSVKSVSSGELDDDDKSLGFTVGVVDTHLRWDSYVYVSKPPYTSCIVFWKGPDGKYDEEAPEDRTRLNNKDNVYAELGD